MIYKRYMNKIYDTWYFHVLLTFCFTKFYKFIN